MFAFLLIFNVRVSQQFTIAVAEAATMAMVARVSAAQSGIDAAWVLYEQSNSR